MSRDMLSQDEIDALLKQTMGTQEESDVTIDDYLSPMEQDALGEIGNISFGSASTALSTLLGNKVEITTPTVTAVEQKNLADQFPSPHVAVHVQFTDGIQGINLLVIKSSDAKIIADLMMGGSGQPMNDELSEMDVSAVQEAMNQMMGSSATSMSTIFNTMVNITPPGIDILNLTDGQGIEHIPEDDVLIKVSFRLKIGTLIDSNIMQLTTVTFAKNMVGRLLGTDSSDSTSEAEVDTPSPSAENYGHNSYYAEESQSYSEPMAATSAYSSNEYHGGSARHTPSGNVKQAGQNPNIQSAQFEDFDAPKPARSYDPNLDMLMDIQLQITVELGRTKKMIREILEMSQGSIVELDKLAGEPVDILANNKLIAKGEVVVIDENFGVRVTDIISQYDRIRKLQ